MDGETTKTPAALGQAEIYELVSPGEEATEAEADVKLGNDWDQRGMARIDKKQELRREFHFFSITGYAMILGCSWEFALM